MTNAEIIAWQNRVQSPIEKALRRAFALGQTYSQQADSESYSQNRKSDDTRAKFEALVASMQAEAPAAPSGKLSGAKADGEVINTNRDYSTVRWFKPKGDPENAWSYPVGGTKVYLASQAETAPHVPAGRGEQA